MYFYVPVDMQWSIVPVRAFTGCDRAVLQGRKRGLRQDWQGHQENQDRELGTGTGHDCAQE